MKKVLFVCVENAGRSQMAEAFAKKYEAASLRFPVGAINQLTKLTLRWLRV